MSRNVKFSNDAWDDYVFFQEVDRKTLKRINKLIKECQRTPFEGLGKPEPLVANFSGYWSRRIDEKNRLVYSATDDTLIIISCRFHYDDK